MKSSTGDSQCDVDAAPLAAPLAAPPGPARATITVSTLTDFKAAVLASKLEAVVSCYW